MPNSANDDNAEIGKADSHCMVLRAVVAVKVIIFTGHRQFCAKRRRRGELT